MYVLIAGGGKVGADGVFATHITGGLLVEADGSGLDLEGGPAAPDGDGIELVAPLTAQGDSAPVVVVITAYGDVHQAVRAMKAGAADYLKKHGIPKSLEELDKHKILTFGQAPNYLTPVNWLEHVGRPEGLVHFGIETRNNGPRHRGRPEEGIPRGQLFEARHHCCYPLFVIGFLSLH